MRGRGRKSEGLEEEAGQWGAEEEAWTLSCCDNRYQGSAQGPTAPREESGASELLINGVYSTAANWGECACLITRE